MAFTPLRILSLGYILLSLVHRSISNQDCHFTINKENGTFHSPGFPGKYPNNLDCVWLITVPEGKYIKLMFDFFDVEFHKRTCIDMVEVKDGEDPYKELLGTYCNEMYRPRYPLYSSSNKIRVWFYSDASDQFEGFNASFTSIKETGCGGQLTSSSGIITSPRYGISPYPSNMECEWIITIDEGKYIKLWFEAVSIELTTVKCIDKIDIWDGPTNNETFLGSVCQGTNPFYSKSNRLKLKFVTNGEGRGQGFLARYTSSITTGCGGDFEDSSGFITSPNYPYSYPTMTECIWRIKAPPNNYISIRFVEFIGMNSTSHVCPLDHIEILDGHDKNSTTLGRFCSFNLPGVIVSSGNHMVVRFQSTLSMTPGRFRSLFLIHSRECNASLGMEDGRIDDTQISASSYSNYYYYGTNDQRWALLPRLGRLNGGYAWCSQGQGNRMIIGEYFQVDLRNLTMITAVATQGFAHRITTPIGHEHIDVVTSYKVEYNYDAKYTDWVTYSDGSVNSTAKGYTEFMGNYHFPTIIRNVFNPAIIANMIRVIPTNFISNFGRHMCLRLEVYGCPYDLGCGKTISTKYPGEINFRGSNKRASCTWVSRPSPPKFKNFVVVLTFKLFDIPCNAGYLNLKEQISGKSTKFCDNTFPTTYMIRASEQFILSVDMKEGTEDKGFDIKYHTESLGCGEIINIRSNGTITSPHFPKNYGLHQKCIWILVAKQSAKIAVHFKEFKLQDPKNGTKCLDYVEIKDGQLDASPIVSRFCGENLPLKFTSTKNSLRVEFYSDNSVVDKGFTLDYEYLPPAGERQYKDSSPFKFFSEEEIPIHSSASATRLPHWLVTFTSIITVLYGWSTVVCN